ncbi:astacin [Oesophagostomum dentatum]|uniref:Metalloendopeptidase n=1 Tax=Oesophagostomum dentatum TaxID=61180 RepID=A0A0B1T853_OESDE|nr:astacin [Oesophagostomum dentatum]
MHHKLYFVCVTVLLATATVANLSAEAKNSLIKVISEATDAEPDIYKINQREGIAEYLYQGDIHLTDEQLNIIEKGITSAANTRTKRQVAKAAVPWPGNRVYYYFDAAFSATKRTIVQKALNYIQARTCISFVQNATVPNKVRVVNDVGCWSSMGMIGGEQYVSLGSGCDVVGIAAHEFAHTLGVFHTQMRNDRDDYITVDLTNVPVRTFDVKGCTAQLSESCWRFENVWKPKAHSQVLVFAMVACISSNTLQV